jgi:hypothetical protein
MLTARKATAKRRTVFTGINITRQASGTPILPDAGVSKLYPLVSSGEEADSGWKGTSWGFVYTKEKIVLAKGTTVNLIYPIKAKLIRT